MAVWWVELAPLTDQTLLPQVVAKALGVRESPAQSLLDALAGHLRAKQLLLLLDNCEHLVAACAQLAEHLLRACPDLRILATSREVLGVTGGVVWHAPRCRCRRRATAVRPAPQESLAASEAVQLFVARAVAVQPTFALSEQNAQRRRANLRQLDGIPLALELAAARMNILSAEQLAQRLDNRFDLLTSGNRMAVARHQTLRAAIDWSYELLTDEVRSLFRRLAVFRGSFSLEAPRRFRSRVKDRRSGRSETTVPARRTIPHLGRIPRHAAPLPHAGNHTRICMGEISTSERGGKACALNTWRTLQSSSSKWLKSSGPRRNLSGTRSTLKMIISAPRWSGRERAARSRLGLRLGSDMWQYWEALGYLREGYTWLDSLLSLDAPVATAVRRTALHSARSLR